MIDLICPFCATLSKADFSCPRAGPVIRRGGTEFVCGSDDAHARCRLFFEACKAAALPAFGLEDDLTRMPQSTLIKIQFGSLLGLRRITAGAPDPAAQIENIDALLNAALVKFGSLEAIPCASLIDDISQYRLPRRRGRQVD